MPRLASLDVSSQISSSLGSDDLDRIASRVADIYDLEDAGGSIIKPIFSFPGGRRFHFAYPNGNAYAPWSDVKA